MHVAAWKTKGYEEDAMQTYQFRHKNRSVVRAGVSDDLYIVLSARGEGAKLACEIVEEMVPTYKRKILQKFCFFFYLLHQWIGVLNRGMNI